eukprot:gnl/MRDRNA2_/MRDRNA2_27469_c0_seq1.p1 gnl/MRDRNA2_/MRDRNA2_27469_c0~~gnl/MRDRNA2_/MRDRNA2_27469_c0_seq1.p1  ORF type:complete len:525 (+),score=185.10 gnl/MRDRNA2_/MRDRNA2_27469_c0_seq1:162-1577(+)
MTAHVEDLKWFTFRYIEAAWKEAMYEILHDRAVRKKALDELLGRAPKSDGSGPVSPTGKDKKKKNPVIRILTALKTLICGAAKKKGKGKRGSVAAAADPDENIEVDWGEKISLEKIQLGMLRHVQFPVDTFRKDLQRGKSKSTLIPIDMIDPKTGLSQRCVNIKTRKEKQAEDAARRSLKQRIKEAFDTPEKKAARAKLEAEREFYENLFGTKNVEEGEEPNEPATFASKAKKEEKKEKSGVWKPEEWMKPTIPEGEATVAGLGGPRSVTTLDYIHAMVASFDRRHGGPEFVIPEEITPTTGLEIDENAPAPAAVEDAPAEETPAVEAAPEPGDEDPLLVDAGAGVGLEEEEQPPAEKPAEEKPVEEAPPEPALPHTSAETSGAGDPLSMLQEEAPATEAAGTAENAAAAGDAPAPPAEDAPEAQATEAKEGDPDAEASKPAEGKEGEEEAGATLPPPAIEVPPAAEPAKS